MAPPSRQATTQDLLDFIAASPTAAHAVAASVARLEKAGFSRLDEADAWSLAPGDAVYVVRGTNAVIAARIGREPAHETGFRLAGAHVDAPGLRLKPEALYSQEGYLQLGVEVYGGPLLASWTDRDLTFAGRLLLKGRGGTPEVQLVQLDRPVCRIAQLAVHLNRDVNKDGLKLDKQRHLPPICGLGGEKEIAQGPVLQALARAAGVARERILAAEVEIVDTQPPAIGGLDRSLYFAPRIDNLAGSHAVLEGLLQASRPPRATGVIALFDNEEIGSGTPEGAGSFFLDAVLERITLAADPSREAWHRARARSWFVSVDGVHAVHPNYPDLHDARHKPQLNGGPVVKVSALQRYATDLRARHWFEACAAQAKVKLQYYVHRTDLRSGSTIGPMTAARLGVPGVDVGSPMLAMHSIRETGGVDDQLGMIRVLKQHFARA